MFDLFFVFVRDGQVLFGGAEVEAANGLAVVVVQENGEVGLGVTVGDAFGVDVLAEQGFDDVEAFEFLLGGDDEGIGFCACCCC